MLPWDDVVSRLLMARLYWVTTIGADGWPQETPVWGTWLDGVACFSCGDDTQKARNLRRDPRVTIHLDSAHGVVVLSGIAHKVADQGRERWITQAMRAKYGAAEIPDTAAELHGSYYDISPLKALAWVDFPRDVTRFEFDPEPAA
jgi:PPOX class probable F420-dependent enzyme